MSVKRSRWEIIKNNRWLLPLLVFLVGNVITMLFMGGIHPFGLMLNSLPSLFLFYLVSAENASKKEMDEQKKVDRFKA